MATNRKNLLTLLHFINYNPTSKTDFKEALNHAKQKYVESHEVSKLLTESEEYFEDSTDKQVKEFLKANKKFAFDSLDQLLDLPNLLKTQLPSLQKLQIHSDESQIDEVKSKLTETNENLKEKEVEIQEVKKELEEKQTENEKLTEELEKSKNEMKEYQTKIQEELNLTEKKNDELSNSLESLTLKISELNQLLEEANSKRTALNELLSNFVLEKTQIENQLKEEKKLRQMFEMLANQPTEHQEVSTPQRPKSPQTDQSQFEYQRTLPDKFCSYCSTIGHHPALYCPQYPMNQQRLQLIETIPLCKNCLSREHLIHECTSPHNCRFCPERHNSSTCKFRPLPRTLKRPYQQSFNGPSASKQRFFQY